MMDEIFADISEGDDIFSFCFEFGDNDLIFFGIEKLCLIEVNLLLKVDMLHLLPVILLGKSTFIENSFDINNF